MVARMQPCPPIGKLEEFTRRGAGAGQQLVIEEHLDRCPSCSLAVTAALKRSEDPAATTVRERRAGPGFVRAPVDLASGDSFGKYTILSDIGAGGMGKVFAAYDTALNRRVALKFLADGSDAAAVGQLLLEATMMARLKHPNVVTVFDAGVIHGEPFIAMELVEGQTLSQWRQARARSVREITVVMAGAARGLAAAHAAGIIHRDIKPQNILVEGERVIVTDFGLSITGHSSSDAHRIVVGTPGYMAPEQFLGSPVDVRTDVFAFCATLHFMLYGRPPFDARSFAKLREVTLAGQVVAAPPDTKVPARLRQIVLKGLAVEPKDRPASLDDLAAALLFDPAARRRRAGLAVAAAGAIAAAFVGGNYLTGTPQRRCVAGAKRISVDWTAAKRGLVATAFARAGLPSAWPALERRIDEFVSGWQSLYSDTCSATFEKSQQSASMLDLRLSCLEGKRAGFGAFIAGLANAKGASLATAGGASLPDLAVCGHAGRANQKPLPSDPLEHSRALTIQNLIDKVAAERLLGNRDQAQSLARDAVAAARRLGYEPLIAQALAQQGVLEGERTGGAAHVAGAAGENPPKRILEEAVTLAERSGDEYSRIVASNQLVREYFDGDQREEADFWLAISSALVSRIGDPPAERGTVELSRGWLRLQQGKRDESRPALETSLALLRSAYGDKSPRLVPPMLYLCWGQGTPAKQVECNRRVLDFATKVLGPQHPQLAPVLNNLAAPLVESAATRPEACQLLRRALAIADQTSPPENTQRLLTHSNLGQCLMMQKEFAAARVEYEKLLRVAKAASTARAQAEMGFGNVLLAVHDFAGAQHYLRLAHAEFSQLLGPTARGSYRSRKSLVAALLDGGDARAALREATALLAEFEGAKVEPPDSEAAVLKGAALVELHDPAQAKAAFEATLAWVRRMKRTDEEDLMRLYLGLGRAEQALGHPARAIAHLEKAVELTPIADSDPEDRAEVALALGRALANEPVPAAKQRACELGREAVDGFAKAGALFARELTEARGFAAKNEVRCRAPQI
jgi:tetratricopeptide (TPR) repeat protein/predicted Ser/Thr protein kinase